MFHMDGCSLLKFFNITIIHSGWCHRWYIGIPILCMIVHHLKFTTSNKFHLNLTTIIFRHIYMWGMTILSWDILMSVIITLFIGILSLEFTRKSSWYLSLMSCVIPTNSSKVIIVFWLWVRLIMLDYIMYKIGLTQSCGKATHPCVWW